jgi:uncharacterized membrane protein YkvA (DUF1232 family)
MLKLKKIRVIIKKYLSLAKIIYRDKRTPKVSKFFLWLAMAYAISPIDLIPDFIPIIGYLDDIIILPILIFLALIFVPKIVYISHYRTVFRKK